MSEVSLSKKIGQVVELSPQGYGRIVYESGPAVFFSFDRVKGFSGIRLDGSGNLVVGADIHQGSKVSFDAQLDNQANTYVATSVASVKAE